MKKLSFIMAVLMILMCMPIMAISAADEVVAPDANAPEDVKEIHKNLSEAYWLYEYESDEAAIADGAFGRFCKAGGFGYAKTWTAVAAQAETCGATVFYLIKDGAEINGLGSTTAFDVGARPLVVDGSLGQNASNPYGYTVTIKTRFLHGGYNSNGYSTLGRTGSITFKNIYANVDKGVSAIMQINTDDVKDAAGKVIGKNHAQAPAITLDNIYFNITSGTSYGIVFRGKNNVVTMNKVHMKLTKDDSAAIYMDAGENNTFTATDCVFEATGKKSDHKNGRGVYSASNGATVTLNNCDVTLLEGTNRAAVQINGGSNSKFYLNGGNYTGGYGFVVQNAPNLEVNITAGNFEAYAANGIQFQGAQPSTWNIYGGVWKSVGKCINITASQPINLNISGGSFEGAAEIIYFDGTSPNSKINISGGNFSGNAKRMIRLSNATGNCDLTISGGTFVSKNFDTGLDVFTGTPTPSTGLIFTEQKNTITITGGTFTAYKDNGVTLATDAAFVYCWKANANVNPKVTVTGGVFNGGKCFVADVVYSGDKANPIDEAKSTFYYYTEGSNGVTLEPKATQGASVRLNKDSSGLRFTATIDGLAIKFIKENLIKEGTELSYGTMIVPSDYVKYAGGVLTMEAFDKVGKAYLNIEAKDGVIVNEDGSVTINAAMINIKEENYKRDFIAVAYIKYTDTTGAEVIKYATNVNLAGFSRNVQEVAHAALADVLTTAAGTYVNKVDGYYTWNQNARKYEFTPGVAYSRYNAEQVAVLKSYIVD